MINQKEFVGVIIPMVTPFTEQGQIDLESARRITCHLADHGCAPFLMGTTGESPSIPNHQRYGFVDTVVEAVNGQLPVYVSISSNCFEESVQMANDFRSIGADVAVTHLPYYYPLKPDQMGEYFISLADAIDQPLVLYNIPATTHMSIPLDVIFELSQHENIYGIKDSEKDIERQTKIIEFCKEQQNFSHFTGWASKSFYNLTIGSDGLVPSTGNIVPGLYRQLFDTVKKGKLEFAKKLQDETDAISDIYQRNYSLCESLTGLKVLMNELGLCKKDVLPPFLPLSENQNDQIKIRMKELNVRVKADLNMSGEI